MRNLIRLSAYSKSDIFKIFDLVDSIKKGDNPCAPFFRGEEVSEDVIVGYEFKKSLIEVQQAVIIYNMESN